MASKLNGQPDENTKPPQNERLLSFQQTSTTSIPPERSREDILQAAIRISLAGGAFADTEFRVFSCRTPAGVVKAPLSIYANSLVLKKASPHFVHLLSGGFSESMSSGQEFVLDLDDETSVEAYGYESDSDLEDVDEDGDDEEPQANEDVSRRHEELTRGDADTGGQSIVDAASAGSSVPPASNSEDPEVSASTPPLPITSTACRPIFVRDMAFKTWQAFTYYAYLGKMDFAPLRSQLGGKLKTADGWSALCETPRCSPKSLYRLADKYDMKDLRELAKVNLKKRLTEGNILPELFSRFTSKYPEILALEIGFVGEHRDVETKVKTALPRWIEEIAAGNLPHAGRPLAALVTALISSINSVAAAKALQAELARQAEEATEYEERERERERTRFKSTRRR